MAQEQKIIRTEHIVVGSVTTNSYGDMIFTDKTGKEYPKISVKRVVFFKDIIVPGKAVQLNYASAYGKEYIWNALPVEQLIQTKEEAPPIAETPKPKNILSTKDEQIERAVWIKEAGECIRSKDIDKTTLEGKALRNAYYKEMCRVLGINLKEKE